MPLQIDQKAANSLIARMNRYTAKMKALPKVIQDMRSSDLDLLREYGMNNIQAQGFTSIAGKGSRRDLAESRLYSLGLLSWGEVTEYGLELLKICKHV